MDANELVEVRQRLRAVAAEHGMQWILDEVDEAASLGIVEVKELREARRQGYIVYEELTTSKTPTRGRRRAEEFLSRRSMTELEQVEALIGALRRVLVDLDVVAAASVNQLNDAKLREPEAGRVSEIVFEPDEGSVTPPLTTEAMRNSADRRQRISALLDRIDREVHS